MDERHGCLWSSREKTVGGGKSVCQGQKACSIHAHLSTTAAGNKVGSKRIKAVSVALAKCPNLHTLNLSGQWMTYSLSAAMGGEIW